MPESSMTQEILYKAILDNISDGIYVITAQRRIVYWNPAAERITGFPSTEMVGKTCCETFLRQIDEEGAPSCGGCPGQLTLADRATHEKNVYFQHRDGYRLPVVLKSAPILGPGGTMVGVAHIFHDNTYNELVYQNLEVRPVEQAREPVHVDLLLQFLQVLVDELVQGVVVEDVHDAQERAAGALQGRGLEDDGHAVAVPVPDVDVALVHFVVPEGHLARAVSTGGEALLVNLL